MMSLETSRLQLLKARTRHCCCKYCGSTLEIRRIIFSDLAEAKTEIFCSHCDKIEYGVEKEIYQSAKYFTEETEFNHYIHLDNNERTKKMNIAKVCDIISWGVQNLGLLDDNGFSVPITFDETTTGSCLLLDDDKIDAYQIQKEALDQ